MLYSVFSAVLARESCTYAMESLANEVPRCYKENCQQIGGPGRVIIIICMPFIILRKRPSSFNFAAYLPDDIRGRVTFILSDVRERVTWTLTVACVGAEVQTCPPRPRAGRLGITPPVQLLPLLSFPAAGAPVSSHPATSQLRHSTASVHYLLPSNAHTLRP